MFKIHSNLEMTDIQSNIFYFIRKQKLWILIRGASEALFISTIGFHGELRETSTFIISFLFKNCLTHPQPITKTRLFKYTENFTTKKWKFFT